MDAIKIDKIGSKGIVMGKAFLVQHHNLEVDKSIISQSMKATEVKRFQDSILEASNQIKVLAENNDIFKAHLEIVEDITLLDSVLSKINDENKNAELALKETEHEIASMMETLDDEYLRERAVDIRDVCTRVLSILKGVDLNPFKSISEEVIIIAKDLTPSDTSIMDFNKVLGFITQIGGVTSHVCIIARSIGIPAVVGVSNIMDILKHDDYIILDATNKKLYINPDESTIEEYKLKINEYIKMKEELKKLQSLDAKTKDGRVVDVFANVGSVKDVENAMKNGAEGIGLFRTEFLYMDSKNDFPSEEIQFEAYKKSAELCNGKHMIIRTLDIGGDKSLPYYKFDVEENPFLGWRAIRISLELKEVFKAQLRAILRASAFGKILIMYPMIISVEEFREANAILQECKDELTKENIKFDPNIETGIMIETPASVINSEDLAKEVDFFSIGTNDLTQYLLAVDRGNEKISNLYDSFHPAVLRSIKKVIDAGHKYNKMVGMCGEFASDERAVQVLLGMGLDEFSMASSAIPEVKYKIRNLNYAESQELAKKVCEKSTLSEVKELIDNF